MKRYRRHARLSLGSLVFVGSLLLSGCAASQPTTEAFFNAEPLPASVRYEAPALDTHTLEQAIHAEVNRLRQEHGVGPLAWAASVATVARAHSRDMATRQYFGHVNPAGEDATARARHAGLRTTFTSGSGQIEGVGENLFATHRYAAYSVRRGSLEGTVYDVQWKSETDIVAETVAAWMQSPAHRANLLSAVYAVQAIGVVLGDNETVFVTQNLMPGQEVLLTEGAAR